MTGVIPRRVPKRWVKLIIGLFLIPPALVLTQTFFTAFARTTVHDRFWITEEFWFFSLGVVLWMVAFFGLPRPQWLYVFGHELTHALWVTLLGGKVHHFHVGSKGGHVLSDRTNTWIALAPYFFPDLQRSRDSDLRSLRIVFRCGALSLPLVCGHWRDLGDAHVLYLLDDSEGPA